MIAYKIGLTTLKVTKLDNPYIGKKDSCDNRSLDKMGYLHTSPNNIIVKDINLFKENYEHGDDVITILGLIRKYKLNNILNEV
jgi:hypothetical protein